MISEIWTSKFLHQVRKKPVGGRTNPGLRFPGHRGHSQNAKLGVSVPIPCSTGSERGEIIPSGPRIQSHPHPKQLRPTRARERALNLQASRCAPHLLFPEGMDTQTPPPQLPTGVVGPQPPFFTAKKSPWETNPFKKKPPNLSKSTHPWSSKVDPWSSN